MLLENAIPWAGIGALLAGLGSALSGWAALKAVRKEKEPQSEDKGKQDET